MSNKKNYISMFFTLTVVLLLILSGPVSAVSMGIANLSSASPTGGNAVTFVAYMDFAETERAPVKNLTLVFDGAGTAYDVNCTFAPDGTNLTACTNINVTRVVYNSTAWANGTNWAYGFGYGYGYMLGSSYYRNNLTETGSLPFTWQTDYGYTYWNYTNGSSELLNGVGYGYGYVAGYGYSADNMSELTYSVRWTTPSVGSTTAFSVDFVADASDGTSEGYRTFKTSSSTTITVGGTTSSSSSGSGSSGSGSSGGSTSTGDDSSDSEGGDDSTIETQMTEEERQASVLESAPEGYTDVEREGDAQTETEVLSGEDLLEAIDSLLEDETLEDDVRSALEELKAGVESGETTEISVTKRLDVYKATNPETGEYVYRSMVTLTFKGGEKDMENVNIVEVIPKDVAADAADLEFPGEIPKILQADPVVEWTFPTVAAGEVKDLSYIVKKKLDSIDSTTVTGGKTAVQVTPDEPDTPETPDTPTTPPKPTPPEPKSKWLWIILILVVIAVVVAGYYVYSKNKESAV